MPDLRQLADDVFVCAFVPPEKLGDLAPKFRTIINNRPDAEEPAQPSSSEIEGEARRLGLDYIHLPIVPGQITDEETAKFGEAIARSKGPVIAFCRTGLRSAMLWAFSQSGKRSVDEILKTAAAAGYDLSSIVRRLEEKAATA